MARGAARGTGGRNPNQTIGTHKDDDLNGGGGDNYLHGKSGNDTLHGNGGNDIMSGGNGDDLMWGGPGNDTFYYENDTKGHDTIFDWNIGDVIDIARRDTFTITQNGDDVQVVLHGNCIIDILGVHVSDIVIV